MKDYRPAMAALFLIFAFCLALSTAYPKEGPTFNVDPRFNGSFPVNYYGIDVSQPVSASAFACLVKENLLFVVIRCYQSVGRPDPNCAATAQNAHQGGMKVVDGYFFPCPTCGAASSQVSSMMAYFNQHKVNIKTLWLDIEGTQYWLGNAARNQAWYKTLVDAMHSEGLNMGVYSSLSQWSAIFGSAGFSYGANVPIWYAHYDGVPTFDDWQPFGGWSSPSIKQFSDQGKKCGANYDINWKPTL